MQVESLRETSKHALEDRLGEIKMRAMQAFAEGEEALMQKQAAGFEATANHSRDLNTWGLENKKHLLLQISSIKLPENV